MDGGWTDWGLWSDCSTTCGGGSRRRARSCTNPRPSDGGAQCVGIQAYTEDCNYDIHCRGKPEGILKFLLTYK